MRKQGYFIVDNEPDAAMRAAHPMMARVTRTGGYPAGRTSMDTPLAAAISKALSDAAGGPIVRLPTIGGSTPFYLFTDVLKVPTFGLSIVNFDNNQHGAEREPADPEPVGRHRIDGGAADDAAAYGVLALVPFQLLCGAPRSSCASTGGSERSGDRRGGCWISSPACELEAGLAVEGDEHLVALVHDAAARAPSTMRESRSAGW